MPQDSITRSVVASAPGLWLGRHSAQFDDVARMVAAIRDSLSPDLLKPLWRKIAVTTGNRFTGHCYAASEAAYHMLGGADAGWVPCILTSAGWPEGLRSGQTHWFLRHRETGRVVDPTEEQFSVPVDHSAGRGCGFLTSKPSRRAAILIERSSRLLEIREAGLAESVDAAGLKPAPFRVRTPDPAPSHLRSPKASSASRTIR